MVILAPFSSPTTSAETVAVRVMDLIGLGGDPRFAGFAGRIAHREEIDACLGAWCAERTLDKYTLSDFRGLFQKATTKAFEYRRASNNRWDYSKRRWVQS